MSRRMSVVIPAHDEEAVIERVLRGMLDDRLEIVVVANGCRDATAGRARAVGRDIHVIEIAEASKIAALNAGDEAAERFPRAYVDADVEVSAPTLLALAAVLDTGLALVASPEVALDLEGANRWVRAYYAVWELSAFRQAGHIGSGIYALSEEGRRRFGPFPPVIGDDRFVQGLFAPSERATLVGHAFTVRPPRTLRALIARGSRIAAGNQQLRTAGLAGTAPSTTASVRQLVSRVGPRPDLWGPFLLYCLVQLRTRRSATRRLATEPTLDWTRDETSRV
jgi:glycosyltransferase involved in cell wall biosynthesis